jgi:hypothetical protein
VYLLLPVPFPQERGFTVEDKRLITRRVDEWIRSGTLQTFVFCFQPKVRTVRSEI